jgi:hypothetical protein
VVAAADGAGNVPGHAGAQQGAGSFNPVRIATHEHADIRRDVARARAWRDRLGYVFRGPGWAYQRSAAPEPLAA